MSSIYVSFSLQDVVFMDAHFGIWVEELKVCMVLNPSKGTDFCQAPSFVRTLDYAERKNILY